MNFRLMTALQKKLPNEPFHTKKSYTLELRDEQIGDANAEPPLAVQRAEPRRVAYLHVRRKIFSPAKRVVCIFIHMQRFFLHKVFQGKLSNMSDTCLVDGDILISTAALDPEIGLSEFLISEDGSHETMRKILNYSQEILPLEGTKAGGMLSPYVYRVELE